MSDSNKTCPHIGAVYNPMVTTARNDLHAHFSRMRQEQPVCHSPLFNIWFVSRYDDMLRVVQDPQRFTVANSFNKLSDQFTPEVWALLQKSHTFMVPNMFNSDLDHDRLRGPFSKLFAPAHVVRFEPMIRRIATELLDGFPARGSVDYVAEFAFPFPLRVIMEILGVPEKDASFMRRSSDAATRLMTSIVPREEQLELAKLILEYEAYWIDMIAERRANPGDDVISHVVRAMDVGEAKLSVPELVSTISANLVLAGHETTARALGNELFILLSHRDLWQTIVHDPTMIPRMIEELQRYDSTTMGFFRTTTEEVELDGQTIPKGATVFPLYSSANGDETRFPNPSEIDLERPNMNEQVGFGKGIHFCLGAHLARLERRVALELLTARWPNMRLATDSPAEFAATLAQRGPTRLLVHTSNSPE